jgi:ADP-heptose:LPS heptosyltransferase
LKKVLIIRFSSFGDVVQAINASREIKNAHPGCHITWLTKSMFSEFLNAESSIDHVLRLEDDFEGKVVKARDFILKEDFDLVYDAHNNLRTLILRIMLVLKFSQIKWVERPKSRIKRFLLFKLGWNLFPDPFYALDSYIEPIQFLNNKPIISNLHFNMCFDRINNNKFKAIDGPFVLFAPSAAWEMKRWPIVHWKKLINKISINHNVVLVGGPNDHFINDLFDSENNNIINLAGKTSFFETFYLVERSSYVLSADTGVIHVAELLERNGALLLGPTAFGRTKANYIKVFETRLSCRPCTKDGRGKCKRNIYQECMQRITPEMVESDIFKTISP